MTPLIVAAALSLLGLDSTAANAQTTTVAPAQVTSPTKSANPQDDPDRVICHREALTGSRFEKRVCMTKAQWDERQRQTDEFERRLGEHPNAPMQGGLSGN